MKVSVAAESSRYNKWSRVKSCHKFGYRSRNMPMSFIVLLSTRFSVCCVAGFLTVASVYSSSFINTRKTDFYPLPPIISSSEQSRARIFKRTKWFVGLWTPALGADVLSTTDDHVPIQLNSEYDSFAEKRAPGHVSRHIYPVNSLS